MSYVPLNQTLYHKTGFVLSLTYNTYFLQIPCINALILSFLIKILITVIQLRTVNSYPTARRWRSSTRRFCSTHRNLFTQFIGMSS